MLNYSENAEVSIAFEDGLKQFLLQDLLGLVLGQVQSVEASVGHWQPLLVLPVGLLHDEGEVGVVYRYLGGARQELHELVHLHLRELGHDFPQPFDDRAVFSVPLLVFGLLLQLHICINP